MIAKSRLGGCWHCKLGASVAFGGTLCVGISGIAIAQVVPDNTLGAESSVVTPNVNIEGIQGDRIDNGAIRGANLFHSFEQFNIGTGRGAYFSNPAGVANIFSRVTGANPSEILGRLGVLGNANLFLINPQGIVFGSGASLDIQGSFLATTGDAIKLGDTGLFSATQPATSNLLTVNPSAILFNTINAQPIVNRSLAPSAIGQPNSDDGSPGLQVQPGRALGLIGGDVLLEEGRLTAAGGRIELGSVAGVGEVSLTPSGNRFVLRYDAINEFGNISLSNGAFVDASGEGGGDVQVRGARLEMTQSSNIWADTLGAENGGAILVRAPGVVLSQSSLLRTDVHGTGTGGNLTIDTERLLVRDGAKISATTYREGKGGSLKITANDSVDVIGESSDGESGSGLIAKSEGSGDAGDLTIDTRRLLVRDGAEVSTDTREEGKGGSLKITAEDSVELIGARSDGQISGGLFTDSYKSGDAGNLTIATRQLLVRDGAYVSATTYREGKGGSLKIKADDLVEVVGARSDGQGVSSLFAKSFGSGDAGDLTIATRRLVVRDGAEVSTDTYREGKGGNLKITAEDSVELIGARSDSQIFSGIFTNSYESGDAGDLTIDTRHLLVRDGAKVSTDTYKEGKGGSLKITAEDSADVIGESSDGQGFSSLLTQSFGSGDAGDLTIDTKRLLVRDGAEVSADTYREGKGGNLKITADASVDVIGEPADGQGFSRLFTQSFGSGDAGDLTITTRRLLVRDGAEVSSSTYGEGKGGSLKITADDSVDVIGERSDGNSSLISQSEGVGDAGDLTIDTKRLLVRDGAVVSSSSLEEGVAGDINITARDSLQVDNGTISTNASRSAGGAIAIQSGNIRLFGNSDIRTDVASGAGGGGNITLTADSIVALGDSDIFAFASDRGGNITLNTPAFFGENYRPTPRNTDSNSLNDNNKVDINATGAVSGIITIPDVSFIQNSLIELPENQINTDSLLANSCIVRRNQPTRGSFTITGTGGLPQRPGDAQMSSFPTVDMATLPSDRTPSNPHPHRAWQKGDPIIEPQGVYRLPNGKLVLSRECS